MNSDSVQNTLHLVMTPDINLKEQEVLNQRIKSNIAKLSIIVCLGLQIIPCTESSPLTGSLRFTPSQKELDNNQATNIFDMNYPGSDE